MAYTVAVNPAILKSAGMPAGPSLAATILTAIFGTLLMGFYANRPLPSARTWAKTRSSLSQSCTCSATHGILFILMTVFRLRQ